MKIAFVSNFLNHHQLPLCLAFYNRFGDNFKFIATAKIPQERLDMKYEDMNHKYDFVICTYDNSTAYKKSFDIVKEYDVVIIGDAPVDFLDIRMRTGKITFRFCERSLKKGLWRRFIPSTAYRIYKEYIKYRKSPLYILAASAYTSYDLSLCGFPAIKCFKWGYFPEFREYSDVEQLISSKRDNNRDIIKILWVARLIPLKHPECCVLLAQHLKERGYSFHINVVGDGIMRESISQMVKSQHLENEITLIGSIDSNQTRNLMEQSDIFIFTSDSNEGWGAVVNESMNSACAVVASHAVGSAPYLIRHGETGLIYEFNNNEDFFAKVKLLLDNSLIRENLSRSAYSAIRNEWNANIAVQRFLDLIQSIMSGQSEIFETGPCSKAELLNPNKIIQ